MQIDNAPLQPDKLLVRTNFIKSSSNGTLFSASDNDFDLWGVC